MTARKIPFRTALLGGLLTAATIAPAQADPGDTSYSVLMNQDNFFGFYPSFNGLIEMNETTDFSFYGILWTSDALSFTGLSSDIWTEFGVGLNYRLMDDKLAIKPQLGLLGGSLLSGGETDDNGSGANVFDGVVPSLTINYSDDTFEAEWYSGYYIATQGNDASGIAPNDFLHLWANGGYKFNQFVSAGAHYEYLDQTDGPTGNEQSVYMWLGPYVQFTLPENGFFARFSGGSDIDGAGTGDFYKLNVGMSF